MKKRVLIAFLLAFGVSCGTDTDLTLRGGVDGQPGVAGQNGRDGRDGVDGKDGQNGVDGIDGQNGADAIIEIVDPCGPGPGPQEIILKLLDGSWVAWYSGVGLYKLVPMTNYATTDAQACVFHIDIDSNYVEGAL